MADTALHAALADGAGNYPGTSWTDRIRALWSSFAGRVAVLIVLFTIACGSDYLRSLADAVDGSRVPMLALAPALVVLAATGYRRAPHGVTDNESDWIFVAVVCGVALAGVWMAATRYPTLSGLWQLHTQFGVLFAASCAMILFGVRHTARLWPVWVFTILASAPVFHILAAAKLGGTDAAVAYVCVAFGTVAAALAGAQATPGWRLLITAATAALGVATVQVLVGHTSVFVTSAVASCVVPVLVIAAAWRHAHPASRVVEGAPFPTRSWRSLAGLVVFAVVVGLLQFPHSTPSMSASATAGWAERAGLTPVADLPFITGFLGPRSSLVRYVAPRRSGFGVAAVDVITTDDAAVLADYHDAVWYPSSRPLNYRDTASVNVGLTQIGMREIQSDAETASEDSPEWYALTWNWRTAASYQQVTVIVNQNPGTDEPPLPQPLGWRTTVLYPLLWHSRQQTDNVSTVPPKVVQYAREVTAGVIASRYAADA